ncbi:MAG: radical SAM protein, partial [Candidatus Pacebacteria bacterium]|nr:radical SAM protein [Candidatus Paceibacterota bacterium]
MKELDIKIGYNCNNNCLFCLNKDKRGFDHNLLNLKNQIKKSADAGCEKIIISGGEPLIYDSFFEILNFAKFNGIRFCEIQTNGRMLSYDDFVKEIKNIFEDASFLVSFHYPDAEMYKKYSRSDGFRQVLKGLNNLKNHKLKVTTNTVLFKGNYMELPKIVDILDKYGCDSIQFRFIDGRNVFDQFHDFVPKMKES